MAGKSWREYWGLFVFCAEEGGCSSGQVSSTVSTQVDYYPAQPSSVHFLIFVFSKKTMLIGVNNIYSINRRY